MHEEVLRLEKEFSQAIVKNDAEAVGRFLADDWIIIDPDGGIIDKERFLGVIKSGALTHEISVHHHRRGSGAHLRKHGHRHGTDCNQG